MSRMFNFRIHDDIYEYLSKMSKMKYTTMSQYLTDIIINDKENYQGEYYVYVYLDPRKSGDYAYGDINFDHEPFYVGKGKGGRILQGIYDPNNNVKKQKIIDEIINSGLYPITLKVYDNLSNDKSCLLERELIEKIGRINENSVLSNMTKGQGSKIKNIIMNRKYMMKKDNDTKVFVKGIVGDKYELEDGSLINGLMFLDLFEPDYGESYSNVYYQLRTDHDKIVSIEGGDDTFFNLSDGSKIPQILFYHIYEEMPRIDPKDFFGSSPAEKIVEKVKEMGEKFENVEIGILDQTPKEERVEVKKFFNNGTDGIESYTGSLEKDIEKSFLAKELLKYKKEIKKILKLEQEEEIVQGFRALSRILRDESGKFRSGILSKNNVLSLSKEIRFLIDVEGKPLMNEEIISRSKKIFKKEDK